MYFTDFDNLGTYYDYGNLIAFIKIPYDAKVYKDPYGMKWKADRFIIEKFDSIDSYWNIYNFCVTALKQNGRALKYVKDQSPVLSMEAVKQNGIALEYVKDQFPELLMEAVKQNGHAIQYVKDQYPGVLLEAVKQNGHALYHIKDQFPELCLEAVKENGLTLEYVKDQFT